MPCDLTSAAPPVSSHCSSFSNGSTLSCLWAFALAVPAPGRRLPQQLAGLLSSLKGDLCGELSLLSALDSVLSSDSVPRGNHRGLLSLFFFTDNSFISFN